MCAQHPRRIELAQGLERGPKRGPVDRGHPGTIDARPKPLSREQIIGGQCRDVVDPGLVRGCEPKQSDVKQVPARWS